MFSLFQLGAILLTTFTVGISAGPYPANSKSSTTGSPTSTIKPSDVTTSSYATLATGSAAANLTSNSSSLLTWWHSTGEINTKTPVQNGNVRQSHLYMAQIASAANPSTYYQSFVYETIPRNGNGQICTPGSTVTCTTDDQISIEPVVNITMAWTQFLYNEDVVVNVTRLNGVPINSTTSVVIRPTNLEYQVEVSSGAALITVPYNSTGTRFSVEFQDDLFDYHIASDTENSYYVQDEVPGATGYVSSYDSSMPIVGIEPRNALLIFASPFPSPDLVPSSPADTLYVPQGHVTGLDQTTKSIVYFEPGVYYFTATAHANLSSSVNWVYFAPGAYVKGAVEYNSPAVDLKATGNGVLSGEQYVYQANPAEGYINNKSDTASLRMWQGYTPTQGVTWTLQGVTINAPPFNTMDFTGELNTFSVNASDYKQVGAFFGQTDGLENYPNSHVRDIFYHSGDDTIKTYYSNVLVERVTVWKTNNAPILQFGWYPRQVSNIVVDSVNVIHSRYISQATEYPRALVGSAASYTDLTSTSTADVTLDLSNFTVSNWRSEGISPALLGINPLVNIDTFTIENVWIETLAPDGTLLDTSTLTVYTDGNDGNQAIKLGSNSPNGLGLTIENFYVGNEKITIAAGNWDSYSLGRLDIDASYWGHWTAE